MSGERGAATVVVPRLALRADDAAEALGMSRRHFERHVAADVRVVYTGALKLYPVPALEAWLEKHAQGG